MFYSLKFKKRFISYSFLLYSKNAIELNKRLEALKNETDYKINSLVRVYDTKIGELEKHVSGQPMLQNLLIYYFIY
jgi:hypothetical protein